MRAGTFGNFATCGSTLASPALAAQAHARALTATEWALEPTTLTGEILGPSMKATLDRAPSPARTDVCRHSKAQRNRQNRRLAAGVAMRFFLNELLQEQP